MDFLHFLCDNREGGVMMYRVYMYTVYIYTHIFMYIYIYKHINMYVYNVHAKKKKISKPVELHTHPIWET